jgi:hypothetical protein
LEHISKLLKPFDLLQDLHHSIYSTAEKVKAMADDSEYQILSREQQAKLHQQKIQLRLKNEQYLRSHPELKALVSYFMRSLLEEKPEKPEIFAAEFFTRPDVKPIVLKSIGMK